MNKCRQCGREFEGVYCPDCGTKYVHIAFCPKCGKEVNEGEKFCSACGCNFDQAMQVHPKAPETPTAPASPVAIPVVAPQQTPFEELKTPAVSAAANQNAQDAYEIVHYKFIKNLLTNININVVLAFAIFNFLFMFVSAAKMGVSWGSVYTLLNNFNYRTNAIVVITLSALYLAVCSVNSELHHWPKTRKNHILLSAFQSLCFLSGLALLICAASFAVKITNDGLELDVGMYLLTIGMGVSSLVNLVCTSCDSGLRNNINYRRAVEQWAQKPARGYEQFYTDGTFNRAKYAKTFAPLSVLLVVFVVMAVVWSAVLPTDRVSSHMSYSDLKNIRYGEANLEEEFDYPDETYNVNGQDVRVFYGRYYKYFDQLNKRYEDADELDVLNNIDKFMIGETLLESLRQEIVDERLSVTFENGKVVAINFNTSYNSFKGSDKTAKSFTVGDNNRVDIDDYNNGIVPYYILYDDGSYRMGLIEDPHLTHATTDELEVGTVATLVWDDVYGTMSIEVTFTQSETVPDSDSQERAFA